MLKKMIFVMVGVLVSVSAWAGGVKTYGVEGMVCAFCTQGIEKSFLKEPQVQAVEVSLEKKRMSLTFKDGQALTDAQVAEILKKAGYKMTALKE